MKWKRSTLLWLVGMTGLGLLYGCPGVTPPVDGECAQIDEACAATSDCCDGLECVDGTCETPPSGTQAAIPAKQIELDLIGIHDADSDNYNDNCIGCHGDRADEVALDGVTPAAHATMADLFGTGNDRCVACHASGPEFVSYSAAALREQVDIATCSACHGASAEFAFYSN